MADTKKAKNVFTMADLEKEGKDITINNEANSLGWKLNTSPGTIDAGFDLKAPLTTPLIKKIDVVFPTGIEVTARNMKGVTIRDALDAIHKPLKKKADDELPEPYLKGFYWDPEEGFDKFHVVFSKDQVMAAPSSSSKKSKKKKNEEAE